MPTTSIKISQLDPIASLTGSDFFPIDQSSSIKTYRASLTQLQDLFSTGSFTGSLIGRITGTGTSPQFVGTSSWAISSSRSISSSYSDFSNSSSYALSSSRSITASYALNSNAGDLSGVGTVNFLPIWSGSNKTLGNSTIYYGTPMGGYPGNVSTSDFYIQKGNPFLYITGSGQGSINVYSSFNSSLVLANAVTSSDYHSFVVTGDTGDTGNPQNRGQFNWTTNTASNNFTYAGASHPKNYTADNLTFGIMYICRVRSNGFYFWPLSGAQGVSRDGTFNIGVDSGTENHETRLKIQVFSGSSISPTVDHLYKAIEVNYGSGSSNTVTFCVSSSGKTYTGGELHVNGGVKFKSEEYDDVSTAQQQITINAEDAFTRLIQLGNHATASLTMSRGHQLNVIVNQASSAATASLLFKGAVYSGSIYYNCPIVWKNGSQPSISTGNINRADLFTFLAIDTSNVGPSGSGSPNRTVIYGTYTQNMY